MEAHLAREVEEMHQFRQASFTQFTVYPAHYFMIISMKIKYMAIYE